MKCKRRGFEKLKEQLFKLYPLEDQDKIFSSFLKLWLWRLGMAIVFALGIAFVFILTESEESYLQDGRYLIRPSYNEVEKEVIIKAEVELDEEFKEDITLELAPEKYTQTEFEAVVSAAIPELEKTLLGNNASKEEITENLILPDRLEHTPISITWTSDREEIISRKGEVNREEVLETGEIVMLTAAFMYEEYKICHSFGVQVVHRKLSELESLKKLLFSEIEAVFASSEEEEQIELPVEINGKRVFYEEVKQQKSGIFVFFIAAAILLWGIAWKETLESQEKKREKQLLSDYPELISQFTLLLGAGMTISGAWKRLVLQYESRQTTDKKRRYVYEEMTLTWREIENGISEVEAIRRFGVRIKQAPYLKFSTLLVQNIRKGSKGLTDLLKVEGAMAYEERKEAVKQQGEEAGTKLLLPMLIMFAIVLIVIVVPAFLSF